ncbi:MAG TPA: hypothetical protein VMF61_04680 [Candidatus Acidoferrales bacterium]|nr:hypothetical protein [Candidatus Acidoferrales bacterium]
MDARDLSGDGLEAERAREHLEMVDRILAESSQRLCYGAEYFIVWGLFSGIATAIYQLIGNGVLPVWALNAVLVMLIACVAFTILRGRGHGAQRRGRSVVQREFFNVLIIAIGLAIVVNALGFNLFSNWAQSAIWTFAESAVLFFIAVHGNARAWIAGAVMIVSLAAANFSPASVAGYVLAAGMILGYAGFGVAESLARD